MIFGLNLRRIRMYVFMLKFSLVCAVFLLIFGYDSLFLRTNEPSDGIVLNELDSRKGMEHEFQANIPKAVDLALTTLAGKNIYSLDADGQKLQGFLLCSMRRRVLMAQIQDNATVNISGESCAESLDLSPITHPWSVSELCEYLLTKRILLVGSQTTYALHDKLIEILPSGVSGSQYRCPGAAFCAWHEICPKVARASAATRYKTAPHDLSNSAILRFALSTTLCPRPPAAPVPYVSPLTGVREHDAPDWAEKARHADVLILAKAPVPAPSWAYRNGSFAMHMPAPWSSAWVSARPFFELGLLGRYGGIVGEAWKTTTIKWLPEFMETLEFLSKMARPESGKLLVWIGSRFLEEGCTWSEIARGEDESRLNQLLRSVHMGDRCLFHNVQVYIQHQLLKEILPRFGIFYIPEANPAPSRRKQQESPLEHGELVHADSLITEKAEMEADAFLNGFTAILRRRLVDHV